LGLPPTQILTTSIVSRSFLLFIPATKANLRAVLSYYSSTATVNQEGDVHINDATKGLGTAPAPMLCLVSIMASRPCPETFHVSVGTASCLLLPFGYPLSGDSSHQLRDSDTEIPLSPHGDPTLPPPDSATKIFSRKILLTGLPQALGYFLAGACAGIASRTVTAPLDRLKVYLIAQTSNKEAAVEAAKGGSPVKAVRRFSRPLVDAVKDLWAAGGMRSLFAGKFSPADIITEMKPLMLVRQRPERD
jgi:solute carrier family 25 phosphate transporter 23/24/25/41